MRAQLLVDVTRETDADKWREARRSGLGGSDAAAICGLDPFRSAYTVWLDKRGGLVAEPESDAFHFGHVLEPIVCAEAEAREGLCLIESPGILQHADFPWMLATPDRLVVDGPGSEWTDAVALFEAKTTSGRGAGESWDADTPPTRVQIQVQHYLDVCGLDVAYVGALVATSTWRFWELLADEAAQQRIRDAEEAFWTCVVTNTPPTIDGSRATSEALRRVFPEDSGEVVEVPADLVDELLSARAARKRAAEREATAENKLKALMGEASAAELNGERVATWKTTTTRRVDLSRFRSTDPELADQFSYEQTSRRFLVSDRKANQQ